MTANQCPLQYSLQFTNVALPLSAGEGGDSRIRDGRSGRHLLHQLPDDRSEIGPRPQCRQMDCKRVEPIVEIGAKQPLRHHLLHIAVGGRDDLHIDLFGLMRAYRSNFHIVEKAEEGGLRCKRYVGHLVEKQRSAMSSARSPSAPLARALVKAPAS